VWRELPHHPHGNQRCDSARTDDNQESPNRVPVTPADYHVTQAIGMSEQEPENRPDTSSGRSDNEGHRREAQQAATFVCHLSMVVFMVQVFQAQVF
jgi:hypothetical protein